MTINRRKVVGIQYTRNELTRTSLTPTFNPWRFALELPSNLRYDEARAVLEEIDRLDRIYPEVISFGANSNLSWMFKYQGVCTSSQINNLRVVSFTGNQLVLNGLPPINSTRAIFKANDLIQIGDHPYPFTSTTDVLRGVGTTVTITTNRPNILTSTVTGAGITVGSSCKFKMFCPNMPTYKLVVGGGSRDAYGTIINNAYIEWNDSFQLYEYLGDV